jgi:predicted Zn-dependent protease
MIYWRIDVLGLLITSLLFSLPAYAAPAQIDIGLQTIDPSQAHYDGSNNQAPLAAPDRNKPVLPTPSNFPPESMIPEFGQALPQVPSAPVVPQADGDSFLTKRVLPSGGNNQLPISKRLGILEQTTFGSTYYEHDPDSRLEHLERELLGNAGNGNQDDRLARLEKIVLGRSGFGALDKSPETNETQIGEPQPAVSTPKNMEALGGDLPRPNPVVEAIPFDVKAGDYMSAIQPLNVGQFAHWSKFPIHIHLPPESPDEWQNNLLRGIQKWNQYIPLVTSSQNESADIEIVWINHLVPKLLGITRLVIVSGRMHVEIFMLRPSFYPPQVAEKTLELVVLHELGHALGLYAHSANSSDIMYPVETNNDKTVRAHHWAISPRDVNTLKKVYQSPNFTPGYTTPRPVEWGSADGLESYGNAN